MPKRKKTSARKNCCPRIALVCKKVGGTTLTESFVTVSKTHKKALHHKAKANIPGVVKCAVKVGNRLVTPLKPKNASFSPTIDRYHKALEARGCAPTGLDTKRGPGSINEPTVTFRYPVNTPGAIKDRLNKRVDSLRK